jgi:hypothetical protein
MELGPLCLECDQMDKVTSAWSVFVVNTNYISESRPQIVITVAMKPKVFKVNLVPSDFDEPFGPFCSELQNAGYNNMRSCAHPSLKHWT